MTTLATAIKYASVGLRVIPIPKGAARPSHEAWQDVATTDRKTIEQWFTGKDNGIGLVLGLLDDMATVPTYIFAIDIDGESHNVDGQSTWLDFCAANDWDEPTTAEQITGGGGRHLLFRSPVEIRNGDARNFATFGPGIDVRGAGGFITAEPTLHAKTGVQYQWTEGQEPWAHIADAPQWLLDFMLARPEQRERPTAHVAPTGRPGDDWAAATSWESMLTTDGWTWSHADRNGVDYWCRPGKTPRDGHSASVGYGGSDSIKVFTSGAPPLLAEEAYSKLGYLAATRFSGDHSAAASWCRGQGFGDVVELADLVSASIDQSPAVELPPIAPAVVVEDGGWPIASVETLTAIVEGDYEPVRPDIIERNDGAFLMYRGKVNSIASEPGSGKTWIALHAAAGVLNDGGSVLWIDWEDRVDTAVGRLRQLGVAPDAIVRGLRYVEPTYAIVHGGVPDNVTQAAMGTQLVVLDSMGEALAHSRLNQNDDGEVGAWMAGAARPLARGGAAVVLIDHMVKNKDDQNRFAIGSQRKLAAIDGIAYTVAVIAAASVDKEGRLALKVSKDRHGNYPHGSTVAEIVITPQPADGVAITVLTPNAAQTDDGEEQLLTHLMEKVSLLIEDHEMGMSSRAIEGSIQSRAAHIRTAVRQLVDLGYATKEGSGPNTVTLSIMPYREPVAGLAEVVDNCSEDELSTGNGLSRPSRPDRVPIASGTRSDARRPIASAASPPYGGGGRDGTRSIPEPDAEEMPIASHTDPEEITWI